MFKEIEKRKRGRTSQNAGLTFYPNGAVHISASIAKELDTTKGIVWMADEEGRLAFVNSDSETAYHISRYANSYGLQTRSPLRINAKVNVVERRSDGLFITDYILKD